MTAPRLVGRPRRCSRPHGALLIAFLADSTTTSLIAAPPVVSRLLLLEGPVMHERSKRSLRLSVPAVSARVSMESVASTLARLIASRAAVTRADLVRVTGLARSTVTAGLEMLQEAGVIENVGVRSTTGRGRPPEDLGLSPSFGLILVADLGVRFARLSVHNLSQEMLAD